MYQKLLSMTFFLNIFFEAFKGSNFVKRTIRKRKGKIDSQNIFIKRGE